MNDWTLVYRVYRHSLSTRQRHTEWVRDEQMAYSVWQSVVEEIGRRWWKGEKVSLAYVRRPDGAKIPLVSSAPPHPILSREQFLRAAAHPGPRPARHNHPPVDGEILQRRLQSAMPAVLGISEDAFQVLSSIYGALFWGFAEELAAECARVLGPVGQPPRTSSSTREPVLRRIRALARQAQSGWPATAVALTYLAHAFARETEHRLLLVCNAVDKQQPHVMRGKAETAPVCSEEG